MPNIKVMSKQLLNYVGTNYSTFVSAVRNYSENCSSQVCTGKSEKCLTCRQFPETEKTF